MTNRILKNIEEAEKRTNIAGHIIYVTYPLLKDKKLLTKALIEAKEIIIACINAILQNEYLNKRIGIEKDSSANFRVFSEKCASRYEINEREIQKMIELFELSEKHKESSMEFMKDNKVIMLNDRMKINTLTIEKTKDMIDLAKTILIKTKNGILRKI
jgi:hypothetical protein